MFKLKNHLQKMFSRDGVLPITLNGSPSLLPNNLSSTSVGVDAFCFVRMNDVVICDAASGDCIQLPPAPKKTPIYEATFVTIDGVDVLVVASGKGVQFWTVTGDNLLYFFETPSHGDEDEKFMRGITSSNGNICVGSSSGQFYVFGPSGDSKGRSLIDGSDISLVHTLETAPIAITCAGGSHRLVVCGNENGDLFGFQPASAYEKTLFQMGEQCPVTCLLVNETSVVAGYTSGHIRLFRGDSPTGDLAIEICAHARPVSGLALHPSMTYFASCGEDQQLIVWNMPALDSPSPDITALFSNTLTNKLCTGVAFTNDGRLCVASYDEESLVVFRQ